MTKMEINDIALFSLFHHDVSYLNNEFEYQTEILEYLSKENANVSLEEIAESLIEIVKDNIKGISSDKI